MDPVAVGVGALIAALTEEEIAAAAAARVVVRIVVCVKNAAHRFRVVSQNPNQQ